MVSIGHRPPAKVFGEPPRNCMRAACATRAGSFRGRGTLGATVAEKCRGICGCGGWLETGEIGDIIAASIYPSVIEHAKLGALAHDILQKRGPSPGNAPSKLSNNQ